MKTLTVKLLAASLAAGAVIAPTCSLAAMGGAPVQPRIANVQSRLRMDQNTGRLDHWQANGLVQRLNRIRQEDSHYRSMHGGKLTWTERQRLDVQLNGIDRSIRYETKMHRGFMQR